MPTLALTSTRVDTPTNGTDLRTKPLCQLIPDELHLLVTPLYPLPSRRVGAADVSTVFSSVTECPPILDGRRSLRRHVRLSDDHYLSRTRPREFAAAREVLADVVAERGINRIVVFGADLAELVADFRDGPKVLDLCDSMTLRMSRAFRHAGGLRTGNWVDAVELYRARRTEARLPSAFDDVVTVSEVDTAEIVRLSGVSANVHTVPNGVDEAFLAPMPPPAHRRGVVFWGNLDFEPNMAALEHFFIDVWPMLRRSGVEVKVVGGNAPQWLVRLAHGEPLVHLAGFVPDLRAVVSRYPVMINPMLTGSGIKNKVLEAFGMGIVVVSTARGVEAMPDVVDGEHLVIADGGAFGEAVLDLLDGPARRMRLRANANALLHARYRWSVAAAPWRALFDRHPKGDRNAPRRPGTVMLEASP